MTSESEQLSSILKLCHLAELDEAASIVAEMLQEKFNFHSTGILFWDQDLEVGSRFLGLLLLGYRLGGFQAPQTLWRGPVPRSSNSPGLGPGHVSS